MTIKDILNARAVIARNQKEKIPAKLAYWFMRFMRETETDHQFADTKRRELFEKYADKESGDAGAVKISEDNLEDFKHENEEIDNLEAETPAVRFRLEQFEGVNLTTSEMAALYPFIEEVA